ncbi:hypothetical protein [Palpita vitrealis nucleopolyhedrovirus]|uniref:Uncharacterized protein n=1 Tax=Palpita vitrealis nucleopolyhedrovirus TaxID=2951960 RepID=A0AAE9LNL1_9ABAC|nr:hypothetical protein [Palpita vitrealis nucleopolyhedrovirus]
MNKYKILQTMIINELSYINDNVNYNSNKFFSKNQFKGELHKLLSILLKYKKLYNSTNINYDVRTVCFLLENKNKIDVSIVNNDVQNYVQSNIFKLFKTHNKMLNNYNNELNKLLQANNENLVPNINNIDNIKLQHIQLARLLCYITVIESRNSKDWKALVSNNVMAEHFFNFIVNVLNMIKSNQTSLNHNVSIVYNVNDNNSTMNLQNKLKPRLVTIEIIDKDKFENKHTDIEICYVLNNKLYVQDVNSQQFLIHSTFVELNVLPFCLFNDILPNDQSINVFNLFKFDNNKNKSTSKLPRLGNVMFINSLINKPITRQVIINTIDAYYSACQNLKTSGHRIVADYRTYRSNYKLAALDFIILIFVTNILHRNLKYNMLKEHEKMFQQLKVTVCKLSAAKLYEQLLKYDIDKEPLNNFEQNYEIL